MNLVASMMVGEGEDDRYLQPCLDHLFEFCDAVCVRWESPQGTMVEAGEGYPNLHILAAAPSFFQHEGRARQQLLDFTLRHKPTHVLAVDADEFISAGAELRAAIEANPNAAAFTVAVEEVWKADEQLWIRTDGQWGNRRSPLLYRVPPRNVRALRIANRALACGREPIAVARDRHPVRTGVSLLHFGWACEADRRARYERYAVHDGGRFHRNNHLESIMWDDSRVRLRPESWPLALACVRDRIVERANRVPYECGEVVGGGAEPVDEWVFHRTHPDGRWVGMKWDGTILSGRS